MGLTSSLQRDVLSQNYTMFSESFPTILEYRIEVITLGLEHFHLLLFLSVGRSTGSTVGSGAIQ